MTNRDPLGGADLTTEAVGALQTAVERRNGEPLSSADILAAIVDCDSSGAWQNVQLYTRFVTTADVRSYDDPMPAAGGRWREAPLTKTAVDGLEAAIRIAVEYKLVPVPSGVLALGLVSSPLSAAARLLLDGSSISHAGLLDVIQDDVLETSLEGLKVSDAGPGSRKPKLPSFAAPRAGSRPAPTRIQWNNWSVRQPFAPEVEKSAFALMVEAVERAASDPELGPLLEAMMVTRDQLVEAGSGTGELPDGEGRALLEKARARFEEVEPDPAALIATAAAHSSPRLNTVLRRLGLTPAEVAAQVAEFRIRQKDRGPVARPVVLASLLNGLATMVTTVLAVLAALADAPGSLWKLVFVPLIWTGYPQSGPLASSALAAILALLVSPASGIAHLIGIGPDLLQARVERSMMFRRTGVALSLAEQRRVTVRFIGPRGRAFEIRRQRARAARHALLKSGD